MPTLTELYEEYNTVTLSVLMTVNGHLLTPRSKDLSWTYAFGVVPTLSFSLRNQPIPSWIATNASVRLYVGFNGVTAQVFDGSIRNVARRHDGVIVTCAGRSHRLATPFRRTLINVDGTKTATQLVTQLVDDVGLSHYVVNLPAWTPGTVVPTPLQMQTYADGVNMIASVDGSPFYELPDGQVRIETRDPVPSATFFREYFSGVLDGSTYTQPPGVANTSAYPRILSGGPIETLIEEVKNQVSVRGAQVQSSGPEGETNTDLIETTATASSPWVPDPPGYNDTVISVELIDTEQKAAEVAVRYVYLLNRLNKSFPLTVEGDPEIFLGATVMVRDPIYTGEVGLFFVQGYTCTVNDSGFNTVLDLIGGEDAGTVPYVEPFADFVWSNKYVHIPPEIIDIYPEEESGPNVIVLEGGIKKAEEVGAKAQQYVPEGTGDITDEGEAGRKVIITFDAGVSYDYDGQIDFSLTEWSDDDGHSRTGGRFWTQHYTPEDVGSVQVTCTVYDQDGFSDTIVKTVYINTEEPIDGYIYHTADDSEDGGGLPFDQYLTAVTQNCVLTSEDGGETWVETCFDEIGIELDGDLSEVMADTLDDRGGDCATLLMLGTDAGEILVASDDGSDAHKTFQDSENRAVIRIAPGAVPGEYWVQVEGGDVYRSTDYGDSWEQADPADFPDISDMPVDPAYNAETLAIAEELRGVLWELGMYGTYLGWGDDGLFKTVDNGGAEAEDEEDRGVLGGNEDGQGWGELLSDEDLQEGETIQDAAYTSCVIRPPEAELYGLVEGGDSIIIDTITPNSISNGIEITIRGSGFGTESGDVELDDDSTYQEDDMHVDQTVISWSAEEIVVEVSLSYLSGFSFVYLYVKNAADVVSQGAALEVT